MFNSKVTMVAEVAMRIGCNDTNEQTKKWALAIVLLCHYEELPGPQSLYDKLLELKAAWVTEHKPWYG